MNEISSGLIVVTTSLLIISCNKTSCESTPTVQNGSHKFDEIKYREIHLFPDEGKYQLWNEKMERLQLIHTTNIFKISKECQIWFKEGHIQKGDDIADFYLRL